MKYTTILFDLDGTLTDPAEGICGCIQYALEKGGYAVGPREEYFPWIGPPLLQSFQKYLGTDLEESRRLVDLYRERFAPIGLFENEVYPGIPALLRDLKAAGGRLAVATGKPTVHARRILEHFELLKYFDCVSGISLTEEPLDKHGVITVALRELGVTGKSECVMVGDRCHDVQGAQLSGLDCIGVLYGYGGPEELQRAGATYIAESVEALRSLLL